MRWTDLFSPGKVIAGVVKIFLGVLAFMFVLQLLVAALSRMSALDTALVLVFGAIVSSVAFFIRERLRGANSQPHRFHGSERTPLFPRRRNGQ